MLWFQCTSDKACVTRSCLHRRSAKLSPVLEISPHRSQRLCVESDEAVVGELGSASYFHINDDVYEHTHFCVHWFYAHLSAVPNLGTYAALRWDAQHYHHHVMMFNEHMSVSAAIVSSVTQLCLH